MSSALGLGPFPPWPLLQRRGGGQGPQRMKEREKLRYTSTLVAAILASVCAVSCVALADRPALDTPNFSARAVEPLIAVQPFPPADPCAVRLPLKF